LHSKISGHQILAFLDWKFHFPGRSIKADVPTAIARLIREKLVRQRE
jgi:hypothetical protein